MRLGGHDSFEAGTQNQKHHTFAPNYQVCHVEQRSNEASMDSKRMIQPLQDNRNRFIQEHPAAVPKEMWWEGVGAKKKLKGTYVNCITLNIKK